MYQLVLGRRPYLNDIKNCFLPNYLIIFIFCKSSKGSDGNDEASWKLYWFGNSPLSNFNAWFFGSFHSRLLFQDVSMQYMFVIDLILGVYWTLGICLFFILFCVKRVSPTNKTISVLYHVINNRMQLTIIVENKIHGLNENWEWVIVLIFTISWLRRP